MLSMMYSGRGSRKMKFASYFLTAAASGAEKPAFAYLMYVGGNWRHAECALRPQNTSLFTSPHMLREHPNLTTYSP